MGIITRMLVKGRWQYYILQTPQPCVISEKALILAFDVLQINQVILRKSLNLSL